MSVQTATGQLEIEWDDDFVMVFSFAGPSGGKLYCGFVHAIQSSQLVTGSQTQTTPTVAQISQMGVQLTLDPQTWVETAKNGARATTGAKVVYDDSTSINYTTSTGTIFALQVLYSLSG
jgi:hypothetical protein